VDKHLIYRYIFVLRTKNGRVWFSVYQNHSSLKTHTFKTLFCIELLYSICVYMYIVEVHHYFTDQQLQLPICL